MKSNLIFEVNRGDLHRTRVLEPTLADLETGQVRLQVERFALTANTITYAVAGDLLGYWDFFPAAEAGWGRVPAMGWARVVATEQADVNIGQRFYGWWPMARVVDVQATVTETGLRDDGAHRKAHAPVYRSLVATEHDPLYQAGAEAEDRHALLRGLMQTAFLADDFLAEQDYFGATQLVLLSASSKTAIALAELAAARDGLRVVAATSAGNRDFVAGLGCYDQVLEYENLSNLAAASPTVVVDMAGNNAVLASLHEHCGSQLKYSMAIGRSHHDAPPQGVGGAVKPQFFFAPMQAKKRVAEWGAAGFMQRVSEALASHVARSETWLELERVEGSAALGQAWEETLAGRVAPCRGLIASL